MDNNTTNYPKLILGTHTHKNQSILNDVVFSCLEHRILGFDTAPSYGTEQSLGQILKTNMTKTGILREELYISTKIDGWQMQESNGNIEHYLDNVLKQMDLEYVNQLLIHWPFSDYLENTWESFIDLYKKGKVLNIGVCNVAIRHLERLSKYDISPMIVQNERHPLRTDNSIIEYCKKYNVRYQAYSPVAQMNDKLKNSSLLKVIASKYRVSIGQVIINWHVKTGSTPVFLTTKTSRLKEYNDALNIDLEPDDLANITLLDENFKLFLESVACPGF